MTRSSQCHNNPVLVPPRKPRDPVKDFYDGHNYYLKKKGGYMDEDRCGSSGVWKVCSDILLHDMVISVY